MIAVDRQRACLRALHEEVPDVTRQICVWHAREAIRSNAAKWLDREPGPPDERGQATPSQVDNFMSGILEVLDAPNAGEFPFHDVNPGIEH